MSGGGPSPMLETPQKKPEARRHKEKTMFTDPDMYRYVARQREHELIEEANRSRLARSLRRSRRGRLPDSGRAR